MPVEYSVSYPLISKLLSTTCMENFYKQATAASRKTFIIKLGGRSIVRWCQPIALPGNSLLIAHTAFLHNDDDGSDSYTSDGSWLECQVACSDPAIAEASQDVTTNLTVGAGGDRDVVMQPPTLDH